MGQRQKRGVACGWTRKEHRACNGRVGIGRDQPQEAPLCSNENGLSQRTATDTFLITSNITRRARPSFLIKCHIAPAGQVILLSKHREDGGCISSSGRGRRRKGGRNFSGIEDLLSWLVNISCINNGLDEARPRNSDPNCCANLHCSSAKNNKLWWRT